MVNKFTEPSGLLQGWPGSHVHWDSSHECPVDAAGWDLDLFSRADMATVSK